MKKSFLPRQVVRTRYRIEYSLFSAKRMCSASASKQRIVSSISKTFPPTLCSLPSAPKLFVLLLCFQMRPAGRHFISIPLNLPLHRAVWSVNSPGPRVISLLTLLINSIITASFLRSLAIKLINMLYPVNLYPFPIVLPSFPLLISLIVMVDLRNQSKDNYKQPAYSTRSTSQALHS